MDHASRRILACMITAFVSSTVGATLLHAEPNEAGQVDGILDRLEKRLLDQQSDGLSFGEQQNDPAFLHNPEPKPANKYEYKKGKAIEATTDEAEKIKSMTNMVADLENQVDQLASTVQKSKQTLLDESSTDNFVSFEAQLADTDAAAIKALTIKLDGYAVYELSDASGLWMPSKSVPLYAGPLQPGNHRIDMEARLVIRHKDQLPLNSDVYRFINKTFDVNIGGAKTNTRYVIAIKPPEKSDSAADASIKEIR